jgi:hypothetical protein
MRDDIYKSARVKQFILHASEHFFLLFFIRSRSVFPAKKGASTIVAYRVFKRSDHLMYEISDLHRP